MLRHAMSCYAMLLLAMNWFGDEWIWRCADPTHSGNSDGTSGRCHQMGQAIQRLDDERLETKEHPSREKEHHNVHNAHNKK
mmetsp:Transcript_7358/g.18475  ORF Transcript_7358/g.18475 Transcript_7358/m.18475 type:complete len:81 (+) Transcript_7358:336-578(+)